MSISNQITRIQNEVATQTNLLSQAVAALEGKAGGGLNTSDATATAGDILSGKTAYVNGNKVTGNISTVTQPTPTISVDSSGKITANYTPSKGYTSSTTSKSATKQLTTKSATTYTPSTSNQTIASGTYLTGTQTIKGDSNLVADNIKSGVSIFGVSGTLESGITPSGQKTILMNGTYDVTNYASVLVEVIPSGGESGGDSSSSIPTVSSGFINSTAEGTVIYAINTLNGFSTITGSLTYFSMAKKYRHPLDTSLIANTPIIVLTSGTITMPYANGYILETLATGTGYGVYQYVDGGSEPDEVVPDL